MPAIDARFAALVIFCCLSAPWLSSTPTARAAVISRSAPSTRSAFQDYSEDSAPYSQHVFPWSTGKPAFSKNQDHSRRSLREGPYKVRAENPFHRFADAISSIFKGHHKRSHNTIAIPNDHGSLYVLSHARRGGAPQWVSMPNSTAPANATAAQDSPASQGVPGHVDITTAADDSEHPGVRIASLVLQLDDGTYVLNASQNNQTRLYLVNAQDPTTRGPEAANFGSGDDVPVFLEIPQLANAEDYCATYDPKPNGTEPMTMQPCFSNNASNNAFNSSDPHASQIFQYNQRSGQIRPTWFRGQDDGTDGNNNTTDGNNATAAAQGGFPQRPGSGSPQGRPQSPPGTQGPRPGSGSPDPNPNPNARNVTLVFVPAGMFGAADVTESSTSSVVTATTTTTVTVYASATGSSTSTSTSTLPSASGMSVEAVGGVPIVGSAAPSLPVHPPVSPGVPSSSSASASVSASGSASSSSMSAAAVTAAPYASPYDVSSSSSDPASSSTSINATAIASSIAASAYSSWSSVAAASSTSAADPSSTFVAAVLRRGRTSRRRAASPDKTPVSTDPYTWSFKTEER